MDPHGATSEGAVKVTFIYRIAGLLMRVVSELTCYLGRILLYTIKTGPCIELHHFAVTLQTPVITFHKFENIVGSYARRFTVVVSNTFKHVPFTVNNFPVQPPCPNPKEAQAS